MKKSSGTRVLMLLENNPYPGDRRVRLEALTLVAAGYQVTVISPGTPEQARYEIVNQVHVYRYPQPSAGHGLIGFLWEYGFSMAATMVLSVIVLFREGFDVIHTHNPPDTFVLIAACYKLLGKRFIFDHHDLSPEMYHARLAGGGSRIVSRVLLFFEVLSCRLADHVIATNESYKQIEMARGRVAEQNITVVRNGPDLDILERTTCDENLRKKAPIIIGFIGVMGFQDGIDYLLRALRHLVNDLGRTDFYAILMGSGAARDSLMQLSTELGLDEYVWFTGSISQEDLCRYLTTADIFVAPDPSNAFTDRSTMIKVMEYMTVSGPLVAFDLPEHRVSAGDAALYAQPNDELDFARKISTLMDDPARRKAMGAIGRRRVDEELAWVHQREHLLEAYEKLGYGTAREKYRDVAVPEIQDVATAGRGSA